ncbi:MAG: histidinol dehydrogenase [bacterium]
MIVYNNNKINDKKRENIFTRKKITGEELSSIVLPILNEVKKRGDKAVIKYAKKFDNFNSNKILISNEELNSSAAKIDTELKTAIDKAYTQILKFHKLQKPKAYKIETVPGVNCSRKFLPIENVGLYIPGGNAVLISTMLMLGIPALIAGCKRKVVCSVVKEKEVSAGLAYAALKCGVDEFYAIGGAQSIAMMAYGTETVNKVDKIFGPGNQYVTAAKNLVSIDYDGCLIDMPAGPSEVLIIADEYAEPKFIASDLLSQAEHGNDSQGILLTNSEILAEKVNIEINNQIKNLPRMNFAINSMKNSFLLIVNSLEEAINLSNNYAPEHLIINTKNCVKLSNQVTNAGSVFLGAYSPESAGDYASGTNHSLPTYGYAKATGGVSVESFMKPITFQMLTKQGLKNISKSVIKLAETEQLEAHANAIKIRL